MYAGSGDLPLSQFLVSRWHVGLVAVSIIGDTPLLESEA